MSNILLAPHCDDEGLFASYIIMRTRPKVYVVADGTTHEKFGVTAQDRRNETIKACALLGVEVEFLGIPEHTLTEQDLLQLLPFLPQGLVFAPALQGGHAHHDLLSRVAKHRYQDQVLFYSTYAKDDLTPRGELAVMPTQDEIDKKEQVLECYTSQLRINPHHFAAVHGHPEYLSL